MDWLIELPKAIIRLILSVLHGIISKVLSVAITIAVIGGGWYLVFTYKPEWIDAMLGRAGKTAAGITQGILSGQADMTSPEGLLALLGGVEPSTEAQPIAMGEVNIPAELAPLLVALKDSKDIGKYVQMLSVDHMGEHGERALPLLRKALDSKNPTLAPAAYISLKNINTPEAQAMVEEYSHYSEAQ